MLDDTHFRVSFSGNDVTSREQVETYLLYRAAELTSAKGFDWFEMVDRHTQTPARPTSRPYGYGAVWRFGRRAWRFYATAAGTAVPSGVRGAPMTTVDTSTASTPAPKSWSATARSPPADPRAFDARQVMENLELRSCAPVRHPRHRFPCGVIPASRAPADPSRPA